MQHKTRDTYSKSAGSLGRHYDEIGERSGDIDLAFTLAGNPENARVLEIGCGNGRDARAILRNTPYYTGIDTSPEMIELAREKVPHGTFELADAVTYNYDGPYDVVFAFASFRHIAPGELGIVLKKIYDNLRVGGVLYISSNYDTYYREDVRKDSYGVRQIHYYNPDIIHHYSPQGLKKVQELYDTIDGNKWFEVVLKKV